ncbi:MAG TPA: LCP family protein [Candidatus Saccharimonadales bacterium]|nr:LCP family protein [Candidatus Saccharimonadales bacterium]
MPQKPSHTPLSGSASNRRPIQDIVTVKQQAASFPTVGMTLRSYKYDPQDYRSRVTPRSVAVTRSRWQRIRSRITLKRIALSFLVLLLLIGGWLGFKFVYNAHRLFGGSIFGVLSTTKLKGENDGRVNILLAGNSADDPGHSGANLTDSIMVISIDTNNNKAFLLSVPRDLWVHIPHDGHNKINSAYVIGQSEEFDDSGYPKGGMGQLEEIVSQDLGIKIDYYALVDYSALKDAVNDVGGITVNIQSSDPRGLYDPSIDWSTHGPLVKLSNGKHVLNGQQALDLARARGDAYGSYGFAGSDFVRTQNQRQMLVALKDKATTAGVLANPAKLSSLFDTVGGHVKTDFTLSEVHRLYDLTKQINGNNIQSLSLNPASGKNLLKSYSSPGGESALIPAAGLDDFSDIQAYINRITSNNPVVQEGATVVVLNGTKTTGLANKIKAKLHANQIIVDSVGDSPDAPQSHTVIIDNTKGKKPATAAALTKILGPHLTTNNMYGVTYNDDFIVIVGSDQIAPPTNNSKTIQ